MMTSSGDEADGGSSSPVLLRSKARLNGDSEATDANLSCFQQQQTGGVVGERPAAVMKVARYSARNRRHRMEDRSTLIDDLSQSVQTMAADWSSSLSRDAAPVLPSVPVAEWPCVFGYYAVFDGHSGTLAATYCAANMHRHLAASPSFPARPAQALCDAFYSADRQFGEQNERAGSTAVVALVGAGSLHVAWAGDCLAVLHRRGQPASLLVHAHRPDRPDERARVERLGGAVHEFERVARVQGMMAVARSVGDRAMKPFITAEPDVTEVKLDGSELLLLLASDGLWDEVTPQEAVDFVLERLAKQQDCTSQQESEESTADADHTLAKSNGVADKSAEERVLSELASLAIERGSSDNISIVCVWFNEEQDSTDGSATLGAIYSTDQTVSPHALHVEQWPGDYHQQLNGNPRDVAGHEEDIAGSPGDIPGEEFDIHGAVARALSEARSAAGAGEPAAGLLDPALAATDGAAGAEEPDCVLDEVDGLAETEIVVDADDSSSSDEGGHWSYVASAEQQSANTASQSPPGSCTTDPADSEGAKHSPVSSAGLNPFAAPFVPSSSVTDGGGQTADNPTNNVSADTALNAEMDALSIQDREEDLQVENTAIQDQDESGAIQDRDESGAIHDRDGQLQIESGVIQDRDDQLQIESAAIQDRDDQLQIESAAIQDRDDQLQIESAAIQDRDDQLRIESTAIQDRDDQVELEGERETVQPAGTVNTGSAVPVSNLASSQESLCSEDALVGVSISDESATPSVPDTAAVSVDAAAVSSTSDNPAGFLPDICPRAEVEAGSEAIAAADCLETGAVPEAAGKISGVIGTAALETESADSSSAEQFVVVTDAEIAAARSEIADEHLAASSASAAVASTDASSSPAEKEAKNKVDKKGAGAVSSKPTLTTKTDKASKVSPSLKAPKPPVKSSVSAKNRPAGIPSSAKSTGAAKSSQPLPTAPKAVPTASKVSVARAGGACTTTTRSIAGRRPPAASVATAASSRPSSTIGRPSGRTVSSAKATGSSTSTVSAAPSRSAVTSTTAKRPGVARTIGVISSASTATYGGTVRATRPAASPSSERATNAAASRPAASARAPAARPRPASASSRAVPPPPASRRTAARTAPTVVAPRTTAGARAVTSAKPAAPQSKPPASRALPGPPRASGVPSRQAAEPTLATSTRTSAVARKNAAPSNKTAVTLCRDVKRHQKTAKPVSDKPVSAAAPAISRSPVSPAVDTQSPLSPAADFRPSVSPVSSPVETSENATQQIAPKVIDNNCVLIDFSAETGNSVAHTNGAECSNEKANCAVSDGGGDVSSVVTSDVYQAVETGSH